MSRHVELQPLLDTSIQSEMNVATVLKAEWKFLKLFFPVLIFTIVSVATPFVTVLFAGRIDKNHLDGIGLANTIYNIVVISLVVGYITVFDTYGAQIYGSTQRQELGTVALKCAAQGGIVYLFVIGPYLNLVYIIDLLPGDDPPENTTSRDYAALDMEHSFQDIAIKYLRMTCSCGYLDFLSNVIANYLAIQEHTNFVYLIAALNLAVHVFLNYVFVEIKDMGTDGLGLAAIGSKLFTVVLAVGICYVMIKKKVVAWSGFSRRVFENWMPMLKLGISGIANLLAELCLLEIATFMSQFDGTIVLSTVLIQFQITSIVWSVAGAVAYSSSILMGNSLGEGNPKMVKLYMKITVMNALIEGIPLGLLAYILRGYLVAMFSNDMEITEMFSNTFWLCCLMIPIDHLQSSLSRGILVSFGKQRFIAVSMSVFCYGVALPIIVLTVLLTDWKIHGIYIGFFSFELLNLLAIVIKIWKLDIPQEIEKTKVRVGETEVGEQNQVGMISLEVESTVETKSTSEDIGNSTEPDTTCETKQPFLTREATWIVITFFGAVFSFIIFSTVSLIR